jgi:hypothetical protein
MARLGRSSACDSGCLYNGISAQSTRTAPKHVFTRFEPRNDRGAMMIIKGEISHLRNMVINWFRHSSQRSHWSWYSLVHGSNKESGIAALG